MKPFDRSIKAVMFTDVVGFTGIMEQDEARAMEILLRIKALLLPLIGEYGGNLVKEMGDATLNLFDTPADAVRCARSLQVVLSDTDIRLRIGIHWGEVLLEEEDVFGDTVNIASRLEHISCPGGVCLSGEVLRNYGSGRRPAVESLGLRKLKGLGRLVDIFALRQSCGGEQAVNPDMFSQPLDSSDGDVEDVPSLAVLLFDNRGSDSEDYYSWSITSDLISDLARAGNVRIAPLTDVVKLQEKGLDRKAIADELSVRYIAGGTLWRKDDIFHLSIELLDTSRNSLLWVDSWQDDWRELPSIKGKLADGLLKTIGIESHQYPWIIGHETGRTEAYDLYLRARHIYEKRQSLAEALSARKMFEKAVSLDPELISARIMLAATYRDEGASAVSRSILEKAYEVTLDRRLSSARLRVLNGIGILQLQTSEPKEAGVTFRKVIKLAGSLGDRLTECRALNNLGLVHWKTGEYSKARKCFIEALENADELEVKSLKARTLFNIGLVNWSTGDDEAAMEYYRKSSDILESEGDLSGQATVLRNMGSIESQRGNVDSALDMAHGSLDIYRELGDRPGESSSMINLGNIFLHCGCLKHADELYSGALDICDETGSDVTASIALLNRGILYLCSGRYPEAEDVLLRTLGMSRELGDREGESIALCHLGEARIRLDRVEEAVSDLRESIALMDSIGSRENRTLATATLALALLEVSPETGEVLELVEQVETDLRERFHEVASAFWTLAEVYRKLAALPEGSCSPLDPTRRREEILELSGRDIRERAELISDPELRDSFLWKIERHRLILSELAGGNRVR